MTNVLAYDNSIEEIITEELEDWTNHWKELRANKDPNWNYWRGDYGGKKEMPDTILFAGKAYSPQELFAEVKGRTEVGLRVLQQIYSNAQRLSFLGSDKSSLEALEELLNAAPSEISGEPIIGDTNGRTYSSKSIVESLKLRTRIGRDFIKHAFKDAIKALYSANEGHFLKRD